MSAPRCAWPASGGMEGHSPAAPRTNLGDLKKKLLSILGAQVEGQYWALLRGYFAFKLTRTELDVLVPKTIGRDNLWLHNRFIRAIYNNAVSREAPPEERRGEKGKRGKKPPPVALPPLSREDESEDEQGSVKREVKANGILSHEPGRAARVGKRSKENKRKRVEPVWEQKEAVESRLLPEPGGAVLSGETGEGTPTPILKKRRKDRERRREKKGPLEEAETPTRKAATPPPASGAEDRNSQDDVSEDDVVMLSREPVRPPLGIPFRAPSVGRSLLLRLPQKGAPRNQYSVLGEPYENCLDGGELPQRPVLHRRMAAIASAGGGLQSVSKESVELMEHALDYYLKSIMGTCVQLARARRRRERDTRVEKVPDSSLGPALGGGVCPLPGTSSGIGEAARLCTGGPEEGVRDEDELISVKDLMTAVEINPQLLGDELAINLERIAMLL